SARRAEGAETRSARGLAGRGDAAPRPDQPAARRRCHPLGHARAGSSHYELLRAFADEAPLRRADRELEAGGYRTHEFGDSVLVERRARGAACAPVWRRRATA